MAHTKGEWESKTGDRITADGKVICHIPTFGIPYEEQRANARLIAAAPDLYESLKDLLYHYRLRVNMIDQAVVNSAQQALAKAEGK